MKKLIFPLIMMIAVGCSASPRVEVKTEVVTNRTAPKDIYGSYITNILFCATNYNRFYLYGEEMCEGLRKERDELRNKVSELTYPKNITDWQYVWSNVYFTVYEGTNVLSGWTNSTCIKKITTKTSVTQKIRTNTTVAVEDIKDGH